MDWKEVGNTAIKLGAPLLGGALFGPAGAAVGSMIAGKFGVTEPTPGNVIAAITGDPDAALKLREIETRHTEKLIELENQWFSIETADVQNARGNHQHHWLPAALTLILTGVFGAIVGALFIWAVPGENKDMVTYMAGQVSGLLTSCVIYWVGSTRASANKDMRPR